MTERELLTLILRSAQNDNILHFYTRKFLKTIEKFDHIWFWRSRLPERKGKPCRVLARGKKNSVLVEFEDGFKVVTSRYAVRKADSDKPSLFDGVF